MARIKRTIFIRYIRRHPNRRNEIIAYLLIRINVKDTNEYYHKRLKKYLYT